jgi:hypothetical protein
MLRINTYTVQAYINGSWQPPAAGEWTEGTERGAQALREHAIENLGYNRLSVRIVNEYGTTIEGDPSDDNNLAQAEPMTAALIPTIIIYSGEGEGPGTASNHTGRLTERAVLGRLRRERCGGDRWAYAVINGNRVADTDIGYALHCLTQEIDG